jgi:pimeloyl-ACP methyl ester carboxylesterase
VRRLAKHYSDTLDGPCIVWHTGGGGDGRMWHEAGYTTSLPGFRHLTFDHRGHGRSDRPTRLEDHRIDEYVADVLALLDHAGVDRATFVGYSAGGIVGCELLARAPERWNGFIALGCVPESEEDPGASLDLAAYSRSVGLREVITEMSEQEDETAPTWFLDNLAQTETEMFALLLEGWTSTTSRSWDVLPQIGAPTLFIAGSKECPAATFEAVVARTPRAQGWLLPGFGHLQTFWRSDVVAPLIACFVSAVPEHETERTSGTRAP